MKKGREVLTMNKRNFDGLVNLIFKDQQALKKKQRQTDKINLTYKLNTNRNMMMRENKKEW